MAYAVTLGGWLTAAAAVAATVSLRRLLVQRMDAVARACHELRGPLGAARLGLELGVRLGQLSSARMRAIELELGRASLALDDLIQVRSRPAAASLRHRVGRPPRAEVARWAREEIDMCELLEDSVEAWRAAAATRGLALRVGWYGQRAIVLGHRLRLAQATGNLLANAIEHGGGPIEVRGSVRHSTVRIEVLDDGPGLPASVAELVGRGLGRRALRGGGPRAGGGPTRGHGLAIASAVAAAHGGGLAAAPSNRGARLVLELPAVGKAAISSPR